MPGNLKKELPKRTVKANAAALAAPAAGYGIAQILETIGSMSLPSVSLGSVASAAAPAVALSLPIASTVQGIIDMYNGIERKMPITPLQRLQAVYTPDATRVARPIIPEVIGRPAITRHGAIPVSMTDTRVMTAAQDSTSTASRDSTQTTTRDSTGTTSSPAPLNPQNNSKKSWREKLGDRIAGRKKKGNSEQSSKGKVWNWVKENPWKAGAITFVGTSHPAREHIWKPFVNDVVVPVAKGAYEFWTGEPVPTKKDTTDTRLNVLYESGRTPLVVEPDTAVPVIRLLGDTAISLRIKHVSDSENGW